MRSARLRTENKKYNVFDSESLNDLRFGMRRKDMAEIVDVVRLIPQERVYQSTVEEIGPSSTDRGRNRGRDPDFSRSKSRSVSKGRTKINCKRKENQSEFSETLPTEGFGEENQHSIPEREPHNTQCDIAYTSEDGCLQTKLTSERIDEQIIDVPLPLSILVETVAVMKLVPHEHAQTDPG